jgi:hypothetical protein
MGEPQLVLLAEFGAWWSIILQIGAGLELNINDV